MSYVWGITGKRTFTFKESKITSYESGCSSNGTTVTEGQIPWFFLIMKKMKRETNLFGITFNKVVYYPLN